MSVLFDGVDQYAEHAAAVTLSFPFAMSAWVYFPAAASDMAIMSVSDASGDEYHALMMIGSGTNQIRARTRASSTNGDADSTANISTGGWHHVLGVWLAADDRDVYLDGANVGTDTTSLAPAGLDVSTIGRISGGTPGSFANARVAHATIWNLSTDLTTNERTNLANGLHPILVRPNEIEAYWSLPGPSYGGDPFGGHTLTYNNSPTAEAQPPTYNPSFINVGAPPASAPSGPNPEQSASNSITFSQSVTVGRTFTPSNSVSFGQWAYTNIKVLRQSNSIEFNQIVLPNLELSTSANSQLIFEQLVKRGFLESASSSITFTDEAARGADPSNQIAFTQAVSEVSGKPGNTSFGFNQSVTIQKELCISVVTQISFDQEPALLTDANCNEGKYIATGSMPTITFTAPTSITLTCLSDSIVLRNPDFQNTESVELTRAFNVSRSGKFFAARDSTRPNPIRLNFSVSMFNKAKHDELLDFLENCLGEEITLTDHEGRTRVGILVNPEEALGTLKDGACGTFLANIEMLVDP